LCGEKKKKNETYSTVNPERRKRKKKGREEGKLAELAQGLGSDEELTTLWHIGTFWTKKKEKKKGTVVSISRKKGEKESWLRRLLNI